MKYLIILFMLISNNLYAFTQTRSMFIYVAFTECLKYKTDLVSVGMNPQGYVIILCENGKQKLRLIDPTLKFPDNINIERVEK